MTHRSDIGQWDTQPRHRRGVDHALLITLSLVWSESMANERAGGQPSLSLLPWLQHTWFANIKFITVQ